MITRVVLAKLSPTMEEGTIVKWNKKEGDAVKVGDVLAEIETDKANMEMEALGNGILRKVLVPAGGNRANLVWIDQRDTLKAAQETGKDGLARLFGEKSQHLFGKIELLTPARPGLWAGILTFRVPGKTAADLAAAVERTHRVHVRAIRWPNDAGGALRLSLHVFCTHDDVEKLVQGLQQALR